MTFIPADYRDQLVVADGDLRLELTRRGWPSEEPPELANLRRAEIVQDVVESFLDAGARALVTNTIAANSLRLADELRGYSVTPGELWAINRDGAAICRAAASNHPGAPVPVFGAMGPPGKLLMLEEIGERNLSSAYAKQAEALAAGGADAMLCRGFSEIGALTIALAAARRATGLPAVGSMVFDSGPEQNETSLGVTVPQACAELTEAGAAMIGYESGDEPENAAAVVKLLRRSCGVPIWAGVSAGVPQLVDGQVAYPETPAEFAQRLRAVAAAGANFIGGGRGATVEHIAALAAEAARLLGRTSQKRGKPV